MSRLGLAAVLLAAVAACGQIIEPIDPGAGQLTLTGIAPATGNTATTVTVTGTNIAGNATVMVGGEEATNVVVRDVLNQLVEGDARTGTSVSFTPPQLDDGVYDVTVMQGEGATAQERTLEGAFTFDADFDPGPGPTPGDVLRVNAGGPTVEHQGVTWVADTAYVQTQGATFSNAIPITGSDNPIYQSERNTGGNAQGNVFTYAIPLENGTYQVTLHFAEIYFGAPGAPAAQAGQRVFNVAAQGETVLSNYDVYVAAGNQAATAVTETFTVEVTNGFMNMVVSNVTDRGKLSGLEIAPVNGAD